MTGSALSKLTELTSCAERFMLVLAALRPPRGRCRREIVTGASSDRTIGGFIFIVFSLVFIGFRDPKGLQVGPHVGPRLGRHLGGVLGAILGGFWEAKTRPRRIKMAPRRVKMAPRRPKMAPRRAKEAPRRRKMAPRRSKQAPRRSKSIKTHKH